MTDYGGPERRTRTTAETHISEVLDKSLEALLNLEPKVSTLEESTVELTRAVKAATSTGEENARKIHLLKSIIYLSILGLVANLVALLFYLIPAANDAKDASNTLNDCLIASQNPKSCYQVLAKQGTSGLVRQFSFQKCWARFEPVDRTDKVFDDCASLTFGAPLELVDVSSISKSGSK